MGPRNQQCSLSASEVPFFQRNEVLSLFARCQILLIVPLRTLSVHEISIDTIAARKSAPAFGPEIQRITTLGTRIGWTQWFHRTRHFLAHGLSQLDLHWRIGDGSLEERSMAFQSLRETGSRLAGRPGIVKMDIWQDLINRYCLCSLWYVATITVN